MRALLLSILLLFMATILIGQPYNGTPDNGRIKNQLIQSYNDAPDLLILQKFHPHFKPNPIKPQFVNQLAYSRQLDTMLFWERDGDAGTMQPNGYYAFVYDNHPRLTAAYLYFWEETVADYVGFIKSEMYYDSEDRLIREVIYEINPLDLNDWQLSYKEEHTYGPAGLLNSIEYTWNEAAGQWMVAWKEDYTYHEGLLQTKLVSTWRADIMAWVPVEKRENEYWPFGLIYQEKEYYWDDQGNGWNLDWLFEYRYENDNLVEHLYITVVNGVWFTEWKYDFTYLPNDELESQISSNWDDDFGFVPEWKDEYLYDADWAVEKIKTWEYQSMDDIWDYTGEILFFYDKAFSIDDVFVPPVIFGDPSESEIFYRYMITAVEEYTWDPLDMELILDFLTEFVYSPVLTTTSDLEVQNLFFFPNPASERVWLSAENLRLFNANYVIFDTAGKILYRGQQFENNTLDISMLPPGVYRIRLEADGKVYLGQVAVR